MAKEVVSVNGPSNMVAPVGQKWPQPFTLPDLRRRPDRPFYTDQQDPVVSEATRRCSEPTTTAAWCVTIIIIIIIIIIIETLIS